MITLTTITAYCYTGSRNKKNIPYNNRGGKLMVFSSVEVTSVIVALISTAGTVICAVLGKKAGNTKSHEAGKASEKRRLSFNIWAAGMLLCLLVAVGSFSFMVWRLWPRLEPSTEVAIVHPSDMAQAEQTITVRGTSKGLQEDHVIWVLVFAQEVGRYYPQNKPVIMEAGDRWSSLVYIGVENDTGKKFDIIAVIGDSEAQDAFNAYLAEAGDRDDWPGMVELPRGATIYVRISVIRN